MKLIINTIDGGNLTIEDFDSTSLMQMLEDWDTANMLGIALDTGMAYFPKTSIARIDTID